MATPTEADVGKRVVTANGHTVGTLARIDGPGIYIDLDDDIEPGLLGDIKISQKTGVKSDGKNLAGMPLAAVASSTDDEVRFWPSYAGESKAASATDASANEAES